MNIADKYREFKRILTNSHTFDLDTNGVLTVTDYYTGKKIKIDLYAIDKYVFEEIVCEDEDNEC